jgi:hypothetical protein
MIFVLVLLLFLAYNPRTAKVLLWSTQFMSRYSSKSHDEVASRKSDAAQRRSSPVANGRPPSPEAVERIYSKGKESPDLAQGDKRDLQKPQDPVEKRQKDYDGDVKGWANGQGAVKGGLYPCFDRGKLDPSSVPPKQAPGLKASGQDMTKSPFSAAYRRGQGEGY